MSTAKTKIKKQKVVNFLIKNFDKNVSDLVFIKGGETSQAFSFNVREKDFVIRVLGRDNDDFEKDRYAYDNFASYGIPIPKIYDIGKFDVYHYAISEKVDGKILDEFNKEEIYLLMPEIIRILDLIHSVKVSKDKQFGRWNENGIGKHETWKSAILYTFNKIRDRWDKVYKNTLFEKDVFDKTWGKVERLVSFCPERQDLVHADYGFNNVLSDGRKITGVIDWGESQYGDFLYDVAWLEFWSPVVRYSKFFKKHYAKKGINIDNWNERILCYIYWLAIGALSFFAESRQEKSYKWTKERLEMYLGKRELI